MGEEGGEDDDLFGPTWLQTCRQKTGPINEAKFVELGDRLRAFAKLYRKQISAVPSKFSNGPKDIDVSRQRDWIKNHVLGPTNELINALHPDKRHHFKSAMFDHLSFEPDFDEALKLLNEIEDFAEAAFIELDMQVTHSIRNTSQLQFEIVNGLVAIIDRQFPELRKNRMSGRANQLVILAFKEITGWTKQLDDDIKLALKSVKKNPRGNEPS